MARITVKSTVKSPAKKVWDLWTDPDHIINWNTASEDWHTPHAENDLKPGGKFLSRMEAKDGSFGFDFSGTYTKVTPHKELNYTLDDGRKVEVNFEEDNGETEVITNFDAETENSVEMQRQGWQAIMDSFKKYAEHQRG